MKLKIEVSQEIELIHKDTCEKVSFKESVKQECDEDSEDYQSLCRRYENVIGFTREVDKDEFDKKLLNIMQNEIKGDVKERTDKMYETFKNYCLHRDTMNCYIEFAGAVIDLSFFCSLKVVGFQTRITKQ